MNLNVKYSMGLAFNKSMTHVVLLEKNKPDFLKGFWNAPGGKIEEGETALKCCIREFNEECGVLITSWKHIFHCVNKPNSYSLDVFYTTNDDIFSAKTMTDEKVAVVAMQFLDMYHLATNINWMIPFCVHRSLSFDLPIKIKDLGGD